jgi:class 3 adenylate cyclase/tetratricopeptide (TPR) repeat protein
MRRMVCSNCSSPLPDRARFCPTCGTPVAERSPQTEERKVATVLFADLVGSTALADRQDPERTRATLDRFYEAMAAEISFAGGTLEKFVGDAVMAVFGAPAAQEDHAERALHAALAMRRRLEELFGGALQLRIGVNTGAVAVGAPREGSSFVSGDAVNVAARLEQNVEPGGILVGERTASTVRGAFEFGEPESIDAKGKGGVVCRRLVRALSLMRPRGVGGLRTTFVGRETELELLETTYRRVLEAGEPHLVTLMGDAGIGKTRLVRELWERLGGGPEPPLRRTGRCLPYGHAITYRPLGDILKEHFGILESDAPEVVRTRLGQRQALGLTLGLEPDEEMHPLAARERLHEAWVDFLTELAGDRPAVVLVEDLHWAEEPLLDLLERLARDVHAPLLLMGTARPELLERRPAWGGGRRNASLLWLEPLSSEDSARLIDEELAGALPERLRSLVVERAEGNPFFAEELIGTLVDRGLLERADGGWAVHELAHDVEIPDSVQAVLAARIDLLPPLEKSALQAASVMGRVFWEQALREVMGGAEADLALLEDRDFIRRRAGSSMAGQREYAIKHALTREVAYTSLPKARRARLHAAFATWVEKTLEVQDEVAALLAHHYSEAVRPEDADLAWAGEDAELERLSERAVTWLTRAGDGALRRYELDDAIALFTQALALEPGPEPQAELWRSIGRAHALRYDGEAFWTAMQSSLAIDTDKDVRADTYSVLAFHTTVRSGMWRARPEQQLVEDWVEQAMALSEPGTAPQARALIASVLWSLDDASDRARQAYEIAERVGDDELRAWALGALAAAAFRAQRFEEAHAWAQKRHELLPVIDDLDQVVEVHEILVPISAAVGRLDDARRFAAEGERVASRLSTHHQMHGVAFLLEAEELAGGWNTVAALVDRAREVALANLDTPCGRNSRSLFVCAVGAQLAGDDETAAELERLAVELKLSGNQWSLEGPRIRLALARGALDEIGDIAPISSGHHLSFGLASLAARLDGLAALRDRERIEAEAPVLAESGLYLEPFALRALGVAREDEELLRRAQERFEAMDLTWHAAQSTVLVPR